VLSGKSALCNSEVWRGSEWMSLEEKHKQVGRKKKLNMFLVPIKLGPFKFSPYLILIVFLVPKKYFCTQY